MKIAIIGTGNVGGALATKWSEAGHEIYLGVQDIANFKGKELLNNSNTRAMSIKDAADKSDVILIATPPEAIFDILEQVGELDGNVVIDATNSIRQSPKPYPTVYHCVADKTKADVVKCFNTTGFENMKNPVYGEMLLDMFMAGDSSKAKEIATKLSSDCGFGKCWDFGTSAQVELLEKFALSWINLAIMQGHGRNIGLKIMQR